MKLTVRQFIWIVLVVVVSLTAISLYRRHVQIQVFQQAQAYRTEAGSKISLGMTRREAETYLKKSVQYCRDAGLDYYFFNDKIGWLVALVVKYRMSPEGEVVDGVFDSESYMEKPILVACGLDIY